MTPIRTHRGDRPTLVPVTVALLFVALVACTPASDPAGGSKNAPTGKPESGGTLRANSAVAPSSLDPIRGGSGGDQYSLYPIFDRLVNFTADLKPSPGLAKSWDYPDPRTLVLNLQKGVTFSDGTVFDSAAVKFNLDRARTLETSTVLPDLASISSVDATSPSVVTIHLTNPNTSLPLLFTDRAGMMASPTAVKARGEKFGREPVGAGPFRVASYAPGASLSLRKNPGYWQKGKPYLDGIKFSYIADGQTAVNSVRGGQTDLATTVAPQFLSSLQGDSSVHVETAPALAFDCIYFNFATGPFKSAKARQALQAAIDTKAISSALYFGKGEAGSQLFPSDYWAFDNSLPSSMYDKEKARRLAKDAGLTGKTVRALIYNAPNQARKAQIIQSQFEAVGVDMTITTEEVGAGVTDFYTGHKFDMFISSWSGRPDASQTFTSLVSPSSFYNAGGYEPPGVNIGSLLDAGVKGTTLGDRGEAYSPLAKVVQDQALLLPLAFGPETDLMTPKVGGFEPNLSGKTDVSFLWLAG